VPARSIAAAPDDYLASVLEVLWPAPALVSALPRLARPGRDGDGGVVLLPSARAPRLIVPLRPRRVAAAAVRNFNTSSSPYKQVLGRALALAVRFGAADLLGGRLRIQYPDVGRHDIEAHLSEVLGQPAHVSVWVGPARAVRKPVLQVLDGRGATVAFAKVGIGEFTRHLVRAEAEAVGFLGAVSWQVLQVPIVLHAATWRGNELLVQSALPRGSSNGSQRLVGRAMDELARVKGVTRSPLRDSAYWRELGERVAQLPEHGFGIRLRDALRRLESAAGDIELEYGSWHGDWAPWNMTVTADRVCVWDWERFETGVPVGFDAVHCAVHGPVVAGTRPAAESFAHTLARVGEIFAAHGTARLPALLTVWLYAVDLAARYVIDGELEAGRTRMSRFDNWLDVTLDRAETATRSARNPQ
jgi:hypothetical protein